MSQTRKTNATAVALIKEFESLRLKAYLCPSGIPTIGYGHTEGVQLGQVITEHQAEVIFAHDLETHEAHVERATRGIALNDNQFSALVSFVFNVGPAQFVASTLRLRLQEGDFAGAAREFPRWNKGTVEGRKVVHPGLIRRRAAERALFEAAP